MERLPKSPISNEKQLGYVEMILKRYDDRIACRSDAFGLFRHFWDPSANDYELDKVLGRSGLNNEQLIFISIPVAFQ